MDKNGFSKLTASIKEAGEIKAGRHTPARMFTVSPAQTGDSRAVCPRPSHPLECPSADSRNSGKGER